MSINYKVSSPCNIIKTMPDSIADNKKWTNHKKPIKTPRNASPYIDLLHNTIRAKLRVEGADFYKSLNAMFANDANIDPQDNQLSKKKNAFDFQVLSVTVFTPKPFLRLRIN